MEDKKEVVDSGIIGFSEAEDLQKQLEEKNKKIKELEDEIDDLQDEVNDRDREISDLEYRLQDVLEDNDKDEIKSDVLFDIARRMTIDGILTPELEEWLDNYGRFYVDEV